jgi:hypothetical protein
MRVFQIERAWSKTCIQIPFLSHQHCNKERANFFRKFCCCRTSAVAATITLCIPTKMSQAPIDDSYNMQRVHIDCSELVVETGGSPDVNQMYPVGNRDLEKRTPAATKTIKKKERINCKFAGQKLLGNSSNFQSYPVPYGTPTVLQESFAFVDSNLQPTAVRVPCAISTTL